MNIKPGCDELKEKINRLEIMLENMGIPMSLFDREGILLMMNSAAADVLGGRPGDFIGRAMADFVSEDSEIYMQRLKDVCNSGMSSIYEDQVRFSSGERWFFSRYAPVLNEGKAVYAVQIVSIDITAKKHTEEALKKSEEIFSRFMEHSPIYVFFKDEEIRAIRLSRNYEQMLGMPLDKLLGKSMDELFPSDLAKGMIADDKRVLKEGRLITVEEELNGRFYETIKFPILIEEKPKYLAGYTMDITDRKRGEEERAMLQQRLQQAQKMESIGTLAGGIAHDFNNILFPILAYSELTAMGLPSDSPLQHNIKQIFKSAERARDLVQQILTFARHQEKERVSIKISQILKETVILLRSSIPSTIDIRYDIKQHDQDTVLADPTQINQIIMNLSTNAAHAMEEKGGILELGLTAEDISSTHDNLLPDLEPGQYVKLSVRDTGHGIDPQIMHKIFEPYFTTKERGKGTGMGLAIVHGIVKSYGGDIIVESELGKGTIFNVYLPLVETGSGGLNVSKDSVQYPTGIERILIVDDEKDAVDVLQLILETLGYKVTSRTSSIEALEAFRHNPQGFDLVITDQTMPNMTGKTLARELMSIRQGIPIILCTGYSEQIDEKKAGEMGIRAFVMKPIVMGQIADTIRDVLDRKQVIPEAREGKIIRIKGEEATL